MSGKTKTHHGSFDVANNILDRGIQADWPHQKSQAGFNCSCGANYWHCVSSFAGPFVRKMPLLLLPRDRRAVLEGECGATLARDVLTVVVRRRSRLDAILHPSKKTGALHY